jgi:thioredoxin 1
MAEKKPTSFNDIINGETPVLVDFHATWCGPCHAFAPVLDQLKEDEGDNVRVVKIDVDRNPKLCQKLGVKSMPTVILFQNGEVKWRAAGVQSNRLPS